MALKAQSLNLWTIKELPKRTIKITQALGTRAQAHHTDLLVTMLSVRVPLATIADPQQQQLSPLKGLSLADKENTVSAPGVGGRAAGSCGWVGALAGL